MYDPFHRLKYSFAATYYDQIRLATPRLVKEKVPRRFAPSIRTTNSAWRCSAVPTRA